MVNFESVAEILITAYKDGTLCFNKTVGAGSGDSRTITLNWSEGSWGTKGSGEYEIQLQYRDASGNVLGDDDATTRVKGAVATALLSPSKTAAGTGKASVEETSTEETSTEETSTEETESTQAQTESVEASTPEIEEGGDTTENNGAGSELPDAVQ